MDKIIDNIFKYKKSILIITGLLAIVFAVFLLFTKVDPDIQNMLPYNMKERVDLRKLEKQFGGRELAVILIENDKEWLKDLDSLKPYVQKLRANKEIASVYSLTDIPKPFRSMKQIKQNKLIYGALISKDFKILTIVLNIASSVKDENQLTQKVRAVFKAHPYKQVYFGGMPFIRSQIAKDIPVDTGVFIGLGMFIMLIFLKLTLKERRGMLLPTSIVGLSILIAMGSIYLLDWKYQMVTLILPVILIAIANDYGIHIISRFQEINATESLDKTRIMKKVMQELSWPIILAGLTTIGGLLSLITHVIIPAKQMAVLGAIGIFVAVVFSLTALPSILLYLPLPKPMKSVQNKDSRLNQFFVYLSQFIAKRYKQVVFIFLILTFSFSVGIFFIDVDTNPVHYYPKESELNKVSDIINKEFGGSQIINITLEEALTPQALSFINETEKKLLEHPHVGKIVSIRDLFLAMSTYVYPETSEKYNQIPKTNEDIQSLLSTYELIRGDLSQFISRDREKLLLTLYVNNEGNEAVKSVVLNIHEVFKGKEKEYHIAGAAIIFSKLIDEVIEGQVASLGVSLCIVFLILVLVFRSLLAGFIAIIPMTISVTLLFGIMGAFDIKLDISTTMLSSIVIGVGVDYMIHFLWRFKKMCQEYTLEDSIYYTFKGIGRGILFNSLSVSVGFSVLLLSSFVPVRFFGFLIILSINISLLSSFLLLPSLLLFFKPRFLNKNNSL